MSSRLILNTEIDLLKNNVGELRNENVELNSSLINSKSQINALDLALSNEVSKVSDLSNVITEQKNNYEKELLELKETLVCFNNFFETLIIDA